MHSKELQGDIELGEAEAALLDLKRRRRRSSLAPQLAAAQSGGSVWRSMRGPCRILRLCVLGLVLPALFIMVPLYLRIHVLHEQQYPVALSDVRLLDSSVSTTWCQRQVMSGNASFNAYLMPETPTYRDRQEAVGMVRHLELDDDMKEYWGFYLLTGSKVRISACSRWPGASLIVIRGHKHLHNCAYIGDESSEEEDELAIIEQEQRKMLLDAAQQSASDHNNSDLHNNGSIPYHKARLGRPKPFAGKSFDDSVRYDMFSTSEEPAPYTTIGSTATPKSSAEAMDELAARVEAMGHSGRRALRRLALQLDAEEPTGPSSSEESSEVTILRRLVQQLLQETSKTQNKKNKLEGTKRGGEGGKTRVYRHLHETLEEAADADAKLRSLLNSVVQMQLAKTVEQHTRARSRRDVAEKLALELGVEPKPEENAAFEEGLSPDGIADHRGHFNETDNKDRSNDEFWSSVSSSEEALRNCEGLIIYLPLTARPSCNHPASAANTPTDMFQYVAPTNGYYFFVFSSENEIQTNLISVGFHLERTVYNVTPRVAQCDNTTSCAFPLDFFSSEKVVLEVPVGPGKEGPSPNDSADTVSKHWNEEYLIVSTCEPRTSLYLTCIVLAPVLIMIVALYKL